MNKNIVLAILAWNIIVFLIYGIDKLKAKRGSWRIPEKTLILAAFLLGAPGAFIGMNVFHHKTKHKLFTIGIPVCIVLNTVMLYFIAKVV